MKLTDEMVTDGLKEDEEYVGNISVLDLDGTETI